jgi:hypothetical protein
LKGAFSGAHDGASCSIRRCFTAPIKALKTKDMPPVFRAKRLTHSADLKLKRMIKHRR